MTKTELNTAIQNFKAETKAALQTVYETLSQEQKNKLANNEDVKALFNRFGVEYGK